MLSKAGVHLPGSWGLRGHSGRPADTLRTPCGCPEGAHFPGTVSLSTSKGHDARGGTNTEVRVLLPEVRVVEDAGTKGVVASLRATRSPQLFRLR